jgi:predicted P-loop ATPase/phage/plasmid primase-like uncharacterized protein
MPTEIEAALKSDIAATGIEPPERIVFDDRIHRWKVSPDDSKRSGAYKMAMHSSGRVGGWWKNFKDGGEAHSWSSRTEDRTFISKAIESANEAARKAKESEVDREERIRRVRAQWDRAGRLADHAYLARKKIDPAALSHSVARLHLARDGTPLVMVALRNAAGEIMSAQYISEAEEDNKRNAQGCLLEGLYAGVGGLPQPGARIWVTEGIADAWTVNMLTGEVAVMATACSSIKSVAQVVAAKYSRCTIAFAADTGLAGVSAAERAAIAMGGAIISEPPPEFSDWNHMYVERGVDATRLAFEDNQREHTPEKKPLTAGDQQESVSTSSAPSSEPQPEPQESATPIQYDDDSDSWERSLHWVHPKGRSSYIRDVQHNYRLILENHPSFREFLAWDDFRSCIIITRVPKWMRNSDPDAALPRELRDADVLDISQQLTVLGCGYPSIAPLREVVRRVAMHRRRHVLREHLAGLTWDGEGRIDTWLSRYLGAADTDYTRLIGRKFLIAAVRRVLQPGCKVDNILVLEGRQGLRKSSAARALAYEDYFTDAHLRPEDRYVSMHMAGKWIVEMPELNSIRKSDAETIKAFLSRQADPHHPPYGEFTWKPRQCVFIGSTNDKQYLVDDSGNRRYWPVECGDLVLLEELREDRDMLWAEAYIAALTDEPHWIEPDETPMVEREQRIRTSEDGWVTLIERYITEHGCEAVTLPEILIEAIYGGDHPRNVSQADRRRAGKVLRQMGWESQEHIGMRLAADEAPAAYGRRPYLWLHRDLPEERRRDHKALVMAPSYQRNAAGGARMRAVQ